MENPFKKSVETDENNIVVDTQIDTSEIYVWLENMM